MTRWSSRNCFFYLPRYKKSAFNLTIIIPPIPREYFSNVISFFLKPPESIPIFFFFLPLPEFRHHPLIVRLLQESLYYSPYIQSPSSLIHLSHGYRTHYSKIWLFPWLIDKGKTPALQCGSPQSSSTSTKWIPYLNQIDPFTHFQA